MTERPVGLKRAHHWYPGQAAVDAALAVERFMDVDDYLDRYLVRSSALRKKPDSGEFLMWLLDDDAKAKMQERALAKRTESETDDTGTPLTWRNH